VSSANYVAIMESSCVQQTLIPGTSRLFADYLYHFDRVQNFFPTHFQDPEALRGAAERLAYPESRRSRLVAALRRQNSDSAALSELARPGTVAVVTGQQVGLFSGPAYTIFKALTAVKLAEYLRQLGIPAVPIFWLATEDHDLAEVDHAWMFDQDAKPAKVAVASTTTNGGPVGNVVLSDVPIPELRTALGELPFANEVIEGIEAAYRPGATLGGAFRSYLQNILKDLGLLFIDPLAPEIREIARDFLSEAVEQSPDLIAGLRQRDKELVAAGYHAQVLVEENSSLLFLLAGGKRSAIRWKDGRFVGRDRSYSASELKTMADQISPNALLRPVMQDYLLPTVSYVGGPAETAYLAQSQVLYEKLLGRMPVIFPRNSFTLLDARATKLLERYGLRVPDVLDHQEKVKSRMAAKLVPSNLKDEFGALRPEISSALGNLQSSLCTFDPTLAAAAKKSSAKILYQIEKLSRKTARETMQRDERAGRDAAYLMNLIYPQRHLQERFYSIVPFLAKYGPDLPERLMGQAQLACPDHMVRTI
jgi:bacillithiol biosynthesis cysteine-adding enzyme BshC